jgi:hypothetical protein
VEKKLKNVGAIFSPQFALHSDREAGQLRPLLALEGRKAQTIRVTHIEEATASSSCSSSGRMISSPSSSSFSSSGGCCTGLEYQRVAPGQSVSQLWSRPPPPPLTTYKSGYFPSKNKRHFQSMQKVDLANVAARRAVSQHVSRSSRHVRFSLAPLFFRGPFPSRSSLSFLPSLLTSIPALILKLMMRYLGKSFSLSSFSLAPLVDRRKGAEEQTFCSLAATK